MRIVQLANFYGPRSGGLRTALHHLGAGYAAAGHDVVLVVPGPRRSDEMMPTGVRRIPLRAAKIPYTGGYRAVDSRRGTGTPRCALSWPGGPMRCWCTAGGCPRRSTWSAASTPSPNCTSRGSGSG